MYFVSASTSLLEALQKHRPDVALLQVLVLQPDPAATVSHLHECTPEVAPIIWADPADRDLAVKCIQAGAKDYMLEGFVDARTLHRIVRTAIRAKPGVTAQQATHEPKANFAKRPAYVADEHLVERPGLRGNAVRMRIEAQNFRMLRERNESFAAEELM